MMIKQRIFRIGIPSALLWLGGSAVAEEPIVWTPPGPPSGVECGSAQPGPLKRAMTRFGWKLHDRVAGYPEYFGEPPIGTTELNHYVGHKRAAMPHRFLFYQSDFYTNTDRLTPDGQARLLRMMGDLDRWQGPIIVEPLLDNQALTERRQASVANLMATLGRTDATERVMVAMSPYQGVIGDYSANTGGFPAGIYNNFVNFYSTFYFGGYPRYYDFPTAVFGSSGQ
jgi:hypothetical protein